MNDSYENPPVSLRTIRRTAKSEAIPSPLLRKVEWDGLGNPSYIFIPFRVAPRALKGVSRNREKHPTADSRFGREKTCFHFNSHGGATDLASLP